MAEKKLQLEIIDPTGEVAVTHHFYYNAGELNKLRLTITDNTYIMDNTGKLLRNFHYRKIHLLTQKEIDDENNKTGRK